jgi:5-methylcytosine-specific restriction enzyme A
MQFIWNYLKSFLKPNFVEALGKRSGQWPAVRKHHLQKEPECQACGGTEDLNVHHCIPVHIDESKELDPNNLITLCDKNKCHFIFGHFYSWYSYNTNVREDVKHWRKRVEHRP